MELIRRWLEEQPASERQAIQGKGRRPECRGGRDTRHRARAQKNKAAQHKLKDATQYTAKQVFIKLPDIYCENYYEKYRTGPPSQGRPRVNTHGGECSRPRFGSA